MVTCGHSGCYLAKSTLSNFKVGMHLYIIITYVYCTPSFIFYKSEIQFKSSCTNGAPGNIYTLYYCRVYQVRVAMDRLWLALDQDQPKVLSYAGFRWKGCWTKKCGPLVVSLSLEFSRSPAMLSPLKTTLFPVPALTPRRRIAQVVNYIVWFGDCLLVD